MSMFPKPKNNRKTASEELRGAYKVLRASYLLDHRLCEAGASEPCQRRRRRATEIHHTRGRGGYLLDMSTWLAVCPWCHRYIHDHPREARERGWMITRHQNISTQETT